MTEVPSPLDKLEEFGGLERRPPGETYWDHGRLRRAARFYVRARAKGLPGHINEFIKNVNAENDVLPVDADITDSLIHQ